MQNQQRPDDIGSLPKEQQTAEQDAQHPLTEHDTPRQAQGEDLLTDLGPGPHPFEAINSLYPEQNARKAEHVADRDRFGADIDPDHDPNGVNTMLRKDEEPRVGPTYGQGTAQESFAQQEGNQYGANGQMNADAQITRSGDAYDRFQNGDSAQAQTDEDLSDQDFVVDETVVQEGIDQ